MRSPGCSVLCVGDLMLDEFVYGEVSRISPEAPAPVLAATRTDIMIGGAGNMARNIASLGARCLFVALTGEDEAARTIAAKLKEEPLIEPMLVVDPSRPTTRKVRFVSEHFSTHLMRADWEVAKPATEAIEQRIIDTTLAALKRADVVVLSDYAKGVLTRRVIREVIDAARAAGKPVVVDPKNADLTVYRGASVITPNRKELSEATRRRAFADSEVVEAAREALKLTQGEGILVKRSEHGASIVRSGRQRRACAGASGAGGRCVGAGRHRRGDLRGGDRGGQRMGRCAALRQRGGPPSSSASRARPVVSLAELRARVLPHASLAIEEKIVATPAQLESRVAAWREQGLRVGFTNGCFDILHPGHVKVVTDARAACDRLIVGLNSDASVKRLKGPERPLQNERARAEVLAALEAVDLVVIFEEDTPLRLIETIKPNVLVKGGDYTREGVVGHEIVEANGGEVLLVPTMEGFSTTSLVERAREKKT
jgi:D-beta-D-heptose 7-phosphate kinase/D-beta-D-heptose 1-phosphate adenosyltransferase